MTLLRWMYKFYNSVHWVIKNIKMIEIHIMYNILNWSQWRIQDFPDGRQPIILVICSENCMKLKKILAPSWIRQWISMLKLISVLHSYHNFFTDLHSFLSFFLLPLFLAEEPLLTLVLSSKWPMCPGCSSGDLSAVPGLDLLMGIIFSLES